MVQLFHSFIFAHSLVPYQFARYFFVCVALCFSKFANILQSLRYERDNAFHAAIFFSFCFVYCHFVRIARNEIWSKQFLVASNSIYKFDAFSLAYSSRLQQAVVATHTHKSKQQHGKKETKRSRRRKKTLCTDTNEEMFKFSKCKPFCAMQNRSFIVKCIVHCTVCELQHQ